MPGQWLISTVVSRSFSWAHWGLRGPMPTVTVLKKGSPLEPAGSDLWLTFHDSSLLRLTIGPLVPPTPFTAIFFALFDPTASSALCWKTASVHRRLLAYILSELHWTLHFIPTEKENPYEDVDLKRKSLGRKSCLLDSNRSWSNMDRKLNSPPQVTHGPAGVDWYFSFSCS